MADALPAGRKVVHTSTYNDGDQWGAMLVATCDDGTVWELCFRAQQHGWQQIMPIPAAPEEPINV